MKERGIIFSGEMVRAILEGRKTQTRRVVKPQPERVERPIWVQDIHSPLWYLSRFSGETTEHRCPYGIPGDRLYVRERIYNSPTEGNFYYAADNKGVGCRVFNAFLDRGWATKKSIPLIHMPKWAARIWLENLSVRVERVQETSHQDALAEGIMNYAMERNLAAYPVTAFQRLWDSINGKRPGCSWSSNPWVWVIEFKPIRKEG